MARASIINSGKRIKMMNKKIVVINKICDILISGITFKTEPDG